LLPCWIYMAGLRLPHLPGLQLPHLCICLSELLLPQLTGKETRRSS
jgi:hypothetical protein